MDNLAALFAHTAPSVRALFSGNLCNAAQFTECGYLHLLRKGELTLSRTGAADIKISEPMLVFFPRGRAHSLTAPPEGGADLVCAKVDLGGDVGNPIGEGLPELVLFPLAEHPAMGPVCELLLAEAFGEDDGRQAAIDHLFDYLLILIVRHVVASGTVSGGVLGGLADPRLAKALTAMHEQPRRSWSLDDLAEVAGMSRTRFATHFRACVGRTPMDYLTRWRMTLARELLAKGKPVKIVAGRVGYDSAAAFSRVFARVTGEAPRQVAHASKKRDQPDNI